MNRKLASIVLCAVAALAVGAVVFFKARAHPPVSVTLHVLVTPPEQAGFATGLAKSAKFKYLMGKLSGTRPALAQKLVIQSATNSTIEARVEVLTPEEGKRYAEGFVETLQLLCGAQARVALVDQSVR